MSNTRKPATRPSTARKVTPRTEAKREAALDSGLRITIDGEHYDVRLGDITPALARELRSHVGLGPLQLINQTGIDPDIDRLSAFVWLARRLRGERVEFDDVSVTYAQMLSDGFDVGFPEAEDDPEA
ncbi:MAG TPA: hypothetical protein VJL80_07440 [Aeromicrobium sp.]|nr:hypothetical protein [Aeromicrobium sp.]HKY57855.1 hypothetical protein [Aeromicrobium sp.]